MNLLPWVLVALPLAAGVLLAAAGRPADGVAPPVAVAISFTEVVLACVSALHHASVQAPFLAHLPVRLTIDGLSGVMVVTVTAITFAVLLFSTWNIGPGEARARFYGLMLVFAGAMLTTVTAATLTVLLMGWEVMGATSWALIGYWWRGPERVRAANTAFLTTRAADLGLYLATGAALAGARTGPLALDSLPRLAEPWLSVVTAGTVVAAFGKSAQLPFSFWLSRAMQGPSPVSALLHSATMVVAGAYLLLRLGPLLSATSWGGPAVAWTGAATAVALGLVAVAQTDLKQLLAASSCAQIGFMVLAAGAGAVTGGTLQLIAHAAAKSLAFLVAGAWLTVLGAKTLPALRGASRRARTPGLAFTVAALTLAGLPPLSLWAAKDVLLAGALEDSTGVYALGLAAAAISAVYSVKALWFVWRPVSPTEAVGSTEPGRRSAARLANGSLLALAVCCLALTAVALPPLREALDRVLGMGAATVQVWEFFLSGGISVLVSVVVWSWGARPLPVPHRVRSWYDGWLGLEGAAHALVVRPVIKTARALAVFDDKVLDRAVTGAARRALDLAGWIHREAEARIDRAVDASARRSVVLADVTYREPERVIDAVVEGVATASRVLGRWARRPQTGQLHQYLAQAVTAFTVLALVLVLVR
ncbi:proton-conducting transporter membrane subunit [Streptomyces sp. NPDC053048]|uniref:proton-conducting transporter transmembrane domain-containing protein n=1 Tax=Streptomyces sp. NPDC053048 TaxID=3365694 RepID=UPI0037D2077B